MVKSLLVTIFAVGAITGSIIIGGNLIEEAPLVELPKKPQKEPKNIKELLTSKGYSLLDIDGQQDDEKWTSLINKYILNIFHLKTRAK